MGGCSGIWRVKIFPSGPRPLHCPRERENGRYCTPDHLLEMIKVCRQSLEDCRGCGQAGQGPACQILQMGGVGEMLSVRYCQILQIIAPTSNSPAVSGQQGRMFASDPVRFYNQSPPVLNKDVWGHGFRGSSDLLRITDF